jgi:IS30 family transposase
MPRRGSHYRVLSTDDRLSIVVELSASYDNDRLPHGKIQEIADRYEVHASTISRLWRRALQVEAHNYPDYNIEGIKSRHKNGGRRPMYNSDDIVAAIEAIPLEKRRTIRDISNQLKIPKSTIHRIVTNTGCLYPQASAAKEITTGSEGKKIED